MKKKNKLQESGFERFRINHPDLPLQVSLFALLISTIATVIILINS
ncbi:MAG: hypothetical protein RR500_05760 [Bacilli bacterium]